MLILKVTDYGDKVQKGIIKTAVSEIHDNSMASRWKKNWALELHYCKALLKALCDSIIQNDNEQPQQNTFIVKIPKFAFSTTKKLLS